jgi:hypothetical protein
LCSDIMPVGGLVCLVVIIAIAIAITIVIASANV